MRLITHNMLCSNVKGAATGYPLQILPERVETQESEFSAEFIRNMLPKLEYSAFVGAARDIGITDLPPTVELDDETLADEAFLMKVHHALLDVHILDGGLQCPETGRVFPVKDGIPNMLLHEDEV